MKQYLIQFWDETPGFLCFAEDVKHAVEQAFNSYPDSTPYSAFELNLVWHSKKTLNEKESFVRPRVLGWLKSQTRTK